ncbi:hypothetical protein BV25DRAFT_1918208, partial [Artomyces pyxidatus]
MSTSTNGNGTIVAFFLATTSTTDTCTDISICRTRYTIIWSSLVTILACVWTAVHRNVPEPKRDSESRFSRIVGGVLEAAKIVMVTVLVPEWVLAWAVRQFLQAREVRRSLEWARDKAKEKWDTKQGTLKGKTLPRQGERGISATGDQPDMTPNAPSPEDDSDSSEEKAKEKQLAWDEWTVEVNENIGRMNGKWTARHGFAVIMGGFHCYVDGKPKHPLSHGDVVELVKSGDLVPPTDEEIRNWSQGD